MIAEHRGVTLCIPENRGLSAFDVEDLIVRFNYAVDEVYSEHNCDSGNAVWILSQKSGGSWEQVHRYLQGVQMKEQTSEQDSV